MPSVEDTLSPRDGETLIKWNSASNYGRRFALRPGMLLSVRRWTEEDGTETVCLSHPGSCVLLGGPVAGAALRCHTVEVVAVSDDGSAATVVPTDADPER